MKLSISQISALLLLGVFSLFSLGLAVHSVKKNQDLEGKASETVSSNSAETNFPTVRPKRAITSYSVTTDAQGGIKVTVGSVTHTITSHFSYPQDQIGWNQLPLNDGAESSWRPQVTSEANNQYLVTTEGTRYTLKRQLQSEGHRIKVIDTFTNPNDADVGIIMKNLVSIPSENTSIHLGGIPLAKIQLDSDKNQYSAVVPGNPTFFYAQEGSGLGLFASDNYYRVNISQLYDKNIQAGGIADEHFVLGARDTYERVWYIYPVASTDYFDFLNVLRADLDVNFRIDGSSITLNAFPQCRDSTGNRCLLANKGGEYIEFFTSDLKFYFDRIGANQVILFLPRVMIGDPYNPNTNKALHGSAFPTEVDQEEMDRLREIVTKIKTDAPEVKVLLYFDRWVSTETDITTKYPEARIYRKVNSNPPGFIHHGTSYTGPRIPTPSASPYPLVPYKTFHNHVPAYEQKNKEYLIKALELPIDGIYFDEFDGLYYHHEPPRRYSQLSYYAYQNAQDEHSSDINPLTGMIERRKANLTMISLAQQKEMLNTIEGKTVLANTPPLTNDLMSYHFPRFFEAQLRYKNPQTGEEDVLEDATYVANAHLFTPIAYHRGDLTDAQIAQSIRNYLNHGALLYYSFVPFSKDNNVMQRIYPITPVELHAGYILGEEKIITTKSGNYGWGDQSTLLVYVYDAAGYLIPDKSYPVQAGRRASVDLQLAINEIAIIERTDETVSPPPSSLPASSTPNPGSVGDINKDGRVDLVDYALLVAGLMSSGSNLPTDLNHDGVVDLVDYSLLVQKLKP